MNAMNAKPCGFATSFFLASTLTVLPAGCGRGEDGHGNDGEPLNVDSISMTVQSEIVQLKGKANSSHKTRILYKRPSNWRAEISSGDGAKQIVVYDGTVLWKYPSNATAYERINVEEALDTIGRRKLDDLLYEEYVFGGLLAPFAPGSGLAKQEFGDVDLAGLKMRKVGSRKLDGENALLFSAEIPGIGAGFKLWYGQDDKIIRMQKAEPLGGRFTRAVVTELAINPGLDESLFTVMPEEGADIQDRTNEVIELFKLQQ